jgi:hypothetical protein
MPSVIVQSGRMGRRSRPARDVPAIRCGRYTLSRFQDRLMQVKSANAAGQYKLINEALDPLAAWAQHPPPI